jgi:hypothetical protein
MALPPINSVDGAYWYFIGILLAMVLGLAIYLAGASADLLPDPTRFF